VGEKGLAEPALGGGEAEAEKVGEATRCGRELSSSLAALLACFCEVRQQNAPNWREIKNPKT
jgi:hypothetical protein